MDYLLEWVELGLRWLHLITGIAWIGSSFYFVWLDNHLKAPAQGKASGELWSVHGGGFYHNQKYVVAPEQMPDDLHWFKWEAYFTWISGISLLVLIYYIGAETFLIDPAKADLTPTMASAIGLAAIAIGWLFYDLLCRSPLGKSNQTVGIIWFVFMTFAAWALSQIFNDRAAYIHVGAIVGSVMVGNVFFVIIPNQRKAVKALTSGEVPDPALGQAGKRRSLHNNYMTLPVLFIMISNHYPITYGAERPWLVLALISATGIAVRHIFNMRHRAMKTESITAVAGMLAAVTMIYVAVERIDFQSTASAAPAVAFADVQPIIATHCAACHGAQTTHPAFAEAPLGIVLGNHAQIAAHSAQIKAVAVDSNVMPIGNETQMTDEERAILGNWIAQGAPQ